jgi:hypothetical protein
MEVAIGVSRRHVRRQRRYVVCYHGPRYWGLCTTQGLHRNASVVRYNTIKVKVNDET